MSSLARGVTKWVPLKPSEYRWGEPARTVQTWTRGYETCPHLPCADRPNIRCDLADVRRRENFFRGPRGPLAGPRREKATAMPQPRQNPTRQGMNAPIWRSLPTAPCGAEMPFHAPVADRKSGLASRHARRSPRRCQRVLRWRKRGRAPSPRSGRRDKGGLRRRCLSPVFADLTR
jgi:hypothetical protein